MSHYLDFAATSAVRPSAVAEAMVDFLSSHGATPGRGGYASALEAGRLVHRCRRAVQGILGVSGDPGRVAFMANATQALNTALLGLLEPGDAVVVTAYDHNAVLRPVAFLEKERDVEVRMVSGTMDGVLDADALGRCLQGSKLLVVNCASNVLGCRLPLASLSEQAHAAGALVLADVAQAAGNFPLSCGEDGADLVAFTGHKGLLGPQGIGGLWIREGVEVRPMLFGGTGVDSTNRAMPTAMPDRLEAGTTNAPGIAGLLAGILAVEEMGVSELHAREMKLKRALREGLSSITGVRVCSPDAVDGAPIVMVTVEGLDCSAVAEELDTRWAVQCRSGLHCAPEAHRLMGTLDTGALRLSVGWSSTDEDVARAVEGMRAIAGRRRPVTA